MSQHIPPPLDYDGDIVAQAERRWIEGAQYAVIHGWTEDDLDRIINRDDDEDGGDFSVFSADNIRHDDDDHEGVKARLATGRAARVNNLPQLERDFARIAKDIARCAICNDVNDDDDNAKRQWRHHAENKHPYDTDHCPVCGTNR